VCMCWEDDCRRAQVFGVALCYKEMMGKSKDWVTFC